ncbi:unnamed protein product [Rotaria sordida]|uniref:Peptidase M14 domain-containing protein n=1 Tax=Rotaria sordida TaxID=392033 RepID=A0A814B358_9BILA|nr:unnamed protein product [Rotaria sordida]
MRKHLQHYGYFTGRGEVIKKYGFFPSKSQLISSSSDPESSSSDEEPEKYKSKSSVLDAKLPIRQARIPYGLNCRGGANDDYSFEPRWPMEVEVLNEPRIKHINISPIQPEVFYKPTTNYGPSIRSGGENIGRSVFNYNPESCGYFIRSRIGGNREGCRQAATLLRNNEDTTVLFESRFESGNLMKAVQVGEFEYELYLRYDLYTKRNTQWFYFRMQNIRVDKRYRFTIVNFFKPTSLYSCGMRPLMYSVYDAETKGIGWQRWGEEIVYYKNNLPEGCRQAATLLRNNEDTTVLFESRFESGNLMKAVQVGEFEYELYLRYDLYTKRNTQWFYFRMQNIQVDKRYRFTIVNFFKPTSLYSCGMRPLMYSVYDAETKGIGWQRWGEEIVYYKNNLPAPDNSSCNMYSLTWTCKFPNNNDTYYFAHCYPYTYSDLQDYLNEIQNDRFKSQYCKQKVLCRTLAGNFIYLLTITNPATVQVNNTSTSPENQVKKGVVVTARVHPGETNGSWMMKGLLDFLLGDSADAKLLRDNFIFKIVPMLNPDGVIVGNYRCSLAGRDLNRNYKTILKDAYPSIWHTREMIKRFMNETELVLYCDFHGHSRKQNVFVYGCENKHLPNERFKERIFPAMLSKNDPTKFSLYSCKYKVQKHKEGTGRVVMWSMGIMNSYTLEATFCGSTQQDRAGHHFTIKDFESIGYHFLDSLLDYCDPDHTKRDRILLELEDNIRRSIQIKLLSRGINPGSLDDIDLDQFSSDDDSSDDAGSDSSTDDGLPKHLEAIVAAKAQLKKTRKKPAPTKPIRETKRKDEIDKENLEKNKTVGLPLTKIRHSQFSTIDLLETSVLTTYNNGNLSETNDVTKPISLTSARRLRDTNNDPVRYEGSNGMNNRSNRWSTSTTQITNSRLTTAEEKARRSQMFCPIHEDGGL